MNWTLSFTIIEVISVLSLCALTWFKVIKKGIIREKSIDDSLKSLCGFKDEAKKTFAGHKKRLDQHEEMLLEHRDRIGTLEKAGGGT